ncbi:GAF domain-containing protein [Asaia krungthepensis]|uniref:histidine kinase n=1 Tax=Asaia krungthepensis NRIC 0535 TaxID=1307925 RepID=A0ABQ0Q1X7_9PROT|nr:GAF domain-containing protein [Asaia krungthepensis]GBQ87460.1 signal transduction histidine kinase [Asaia krungthepensis NRIC 0535]
MVDKMAAWNGLEAYDILDTPPERGYDDLVALASQICATQSGVVSLIDSDRQWFKARIGTTLCQTALDDAICMMVVRQNRVIEIEDLSLDDRTAANALVVGEPRLRFYAGVPLRTPFGTIGALAVFDPVPRPGGLTPMQRASLEKLAGLAVDLLELRRQSMAQEKARTRWRSLFQTMQDGFIIARVERDETGRVIDWCYNEINPAAEAQTGILASEAIGRTTCDVFKALEPYWIEFAGRAVDESRPIPFLKEARDLGRIYEGMFYPLEQDFFSITFRDVTERMAAEKRQSGLVALADVLRDGRDIAAMITQAMAVIGKAFGADRATYGELDHEIETLTVAEGWSLPGMPAIMGTYRFDDYGNLRQTLLAGEALVITDVVTDPRTCDESEGWLALKARGVINIPVREDGRNVALMLVHFSTPHEWTRDEIHWLHNAADRLEVAIARRRADEMQAVVNGEIAHRLRNTLAMVQAVARMTLRDALSKEEANRFYERLQSLGRAHDLLHGDDQRAAHLGDLVANILRDASMLERCRLNGPVIRLGSRAAMSTALLIHEMTTNACKHGALRVPEGEIDIHWEIMCANGNQELVLHWEERNGPPAVTPVRGGFGSRLISFGLIGTGGVVLRYEPEGLSASFRADAEKIMRT